MADIDCKRMRERCEELEDVFLNGLSDIRLSAIGIQPGSDRAKRLHESLERIFVHCCMYHLGPVEKPEEPGVPAVPIATAQVVALEGLVPAITEEELALLMRGLKAGLVAIVLMIVNIIARRSNLQICPLVRSIKNMFLSICAYHCPSGRWYDLRNFDITSPCPLFIVVPG
ncbi:MAG: hypothetical protein ACE5DW_05190 [Thermodesulfobacteriota bacterium]